VERPRASLGTACADDEVGRARLHAVGHARKVARVERAVAVHEADDRRARREQPGVARGAESPPRLGHHAGAEPRGEVGAPVAGAVVDDERAEGGRHSAEHPGQRLGLVEHREDDLDHAADGTGGPLRNSNEAGLGVPAPRRPAYGVAAMEAITTGAARAGRGAQLWVPAAVFAVAAATIAYGFAAQAAGAELGASLAPFLWDWRPRIDADALPAAALLAVGVALAPRACDARVRPWVFAASTLLFGLALRVALGVAHGVDGLWAVYEIGNHEAASEYLPALPALDFGVGFFLDTFAEVGTSLPVHAIGHPPGLLLVMHWLGIDDAQAMAALTVGAGALAMPLAYALARELLDERRARSATLLYVFAPSAVLYGATSADALYATLALLAAVPLAAAGAPRRATSWSLPLGAAALALASFFSYANLAVGAWAALVAERRAGLRRAVLLAATCGVALAAFYAVVHLATGYDPIGVLRATETVYREGIADRRPTRSGCSGRKWPSSERSACLSPGSRCARSARASDRRSRLPGW
jgi:methylthioxylose transferase